MSYISRSRILYFTNFVYVLSYGFCIWSAMLTTGFSDPSLLLRIVLHFASHLPWFPIPPTKSLLAPLNIPSSRFTLFVVNVRVFYAHGVDSNLYTLSPLFAV